MMQFFGKSLEATGGSVVHIFTIPGILFYIFAFILEFLFYITNPVLHMRSPFTRIEAIKISKSHSFSIAKAKAQLGYVPIVSMSEGIERTAADFKIRYYAQQKNKDL